MKLKLGTTTTNPVLAAVRRAAVELENTSGEISKEDREEFIRAYGSLMTIVECHVGEVG